jgi:hypothetical protein
MMVNSKEKIGWIFVEGTSDNDVDIKRYEFEARVINC